MVELVGLRWPGKLSSRGNCLAGNNNGSVLLARSRLSLIFGSWTSRFSALDPLIRKEMQDEFLRLQGVLNKTILCSSLMTSTRRCALLTGSQL